MRVYKFRSPCDVDRIVEVLEKKELYCAEWHQLNDPSEGHYLSMNPPPDEVQRLLQEKNGCRVCSLCKDFRSPLMWAHYAGGFTGVAIEVELADGYKIHDVKYVDSLPSVCFASSEDVRDAARMVLTTKLRLWEYEKEVRVLAEGPCVKLAGVNLVIFGCRADCAGQLKPVQDACQRLGIPTMLTEVSGGKLQLKSEA